MPLMMPNNSEMLFSAMYIFKILRRGVFPVDINNANVSYKAISYFRVFLHTTIVTNHLEKITHFEKCVKFGSSFTHFEKFQTALKSPMLTHFEKKM